MKKMPSSNLLGSCFSVFCLKMKVSWEFIYTHTLMCARPRINTFMDSVNKAEGVPTFSISDIKPDPIAHIYVLGYSVDEGKIKGSKPA